MNLNIRDCLLPHRKLEASLRTPLLESDCFAHNPHGEALQSASPVPESQELNSMILYADTDGGVCSTVIADGSVEELEIGV